MPSCAKAIGASGCMVACMTVPNLALIPFPLTRLPVPVYALSCIHAFGGSATHPPTEHVKGVVKRRGFVSKCSEPREALVKLGLSWWFALQAKCMPRRSSPIFVTGVKWCLNCPHCVLLTALQWKGIDEHARH
jgi:hypothetical protein